MEELKEENQKTVFYKDESIFSLKKHGWILVVVSIIIGAAIIWAHIGSGARSALSDAKDIRVAMKITALELQGGQESIYDPTSETGLSNDAFNRIKTTVGFDGNLALHSWDDKKNIPLSFSYRDGKYLVEYKEVGNGDGTYGMNGDWTVYYDFKVLEYTTGE